MKRGKKYVEAAKNIDRQTLYEAADAISLVRRTLLLNSTRQLKHISEQVVMDVMLSSRSEELLFFHTEQVRLYVY